MSFAKVIGIESVVKRAYVLEGLSIPETNTNLE